jgi:hypothetical protein
MGISARRRRGVRAGAPYPQAHAGLPEPRVAVMGLSKLDIARHRRCRLPARLGGAERLRSRTPYATGARSVAPGYGSAACGRSGSCGGSPADSTRLTLVIRAGSGKIQGPFAAGLGTSATSATSAGRVALLPGFQLLPKRVLAGMVKSIHAPGRNGSPRRETDTFYSLT